MVFLPRLSRSRRTVSRMTLHPCWPSPHAFRNASVARARARLHQRTIARPVRSNEAVRTFSRRHMPTQHADTGGQHGPPSTKLPSLSKVDAAALDPDHWRSCASRPSLPMRVRKIGGRRVEGLADSADRQSGIGLAVQHKQRMPRRTLSRQARSRHLAIINGSAGSRIAQQL